jgi:hypothetical protein
MSVVIDGKMEHLRLKGRRAVRVAAVSLAGFVLWPGTTWAGPSAPSPADGARQPAAAPAVPVFIHPVTDPSAHPKSEAGSGSRLDSVLRTLAAEGSAAPRFKAERPRRDAGEPVQDANGRVEVYVHLLPGVVASTVPVGALGMETEILSEPLGIVQGWIPIARLEALSGLPGVAKVSVPRYGKPMAGQVLTDGDQAHKADQLRALGMTGAGVRVGVISDGAESLVIAQGTGDLPAGIKVLQGCSTGDITDGECDEGTATLEIVHDLAPGAALAFCGGPNTSNRPPSTLEFIDCANRLRGPEFGADIIVDDIGFYGEPMLEDGPVASSAQALTDAGIIWVSAAGNNGGSNPDGGGPKMRQYYSADYMPKTFDVPFTLQNGGKVYDALNDFGTSAGVASDYRNRLTVRQLQTVRVVLQWSDAFGNSANDYDLFLFRPGTDEVLASSTDAQNGAGDFPLESLVYTNNAVVDRDVELVVARVAGAKSRHIKLFGCYFRSAACNLYYANEGGQIYGHPAAAGVVAVGAISAEEPGQDNIEAFSSQGPAELFVPEFEARPKPDLVAIDRVNVSGAGGFPMTFVGTSASAPHVAGVLALLKSEFAGDVKSAVLNNAKDLGDAGRDSVYGAGFLDGAAAVAAANTAPVATITRPLDDVEVPVGGSVDFSGACSDLDGHPVQAQRWRFGDGSGVADSTVPSPGATTFNSSGIFNVSLQCTDVYGKSGSSSLQVAVGTSLPPDPPSGDDDSKGGGSISIATLALLWLALAARLLKLKSAARFARAADRGSL